MAASVVGRVAATIIWLFWSGVSRCSLVGVCVLALLVVLAHEAPATYQFESTLVQFAFTRAESAEYPERLWNLAVAEHYRRAKCRRAVLRSALIRRRRSGIPVQC